MPHALVAVHFAGCQYRQRGVFVRRSQLVLDRKQMRQQHRQLPAVAAIDRAIEVQPVGGVAGEVGDQAGAFVDEAGVVVGDAKYRGRAIQTGDRGNFRIFGGDLLHRHGSFGGGDQHPDLHGLHERNSSLSGCRNVIGNGSLASFNKRMVRSVGGGRSSLQIVPSGLLTTSSRGGAWPSGTSINRYT